MMHEHGKSDGPVVCAGQRDGQEGSSPSGARMRGAVSERGGNASRAGERKVWQTLHGHAGESRIPPRGAWSHLSEPGGQGARREAGSGGPEEKYRAAVDGGHPVTNRSAEGGIWSSPHYGGEGVSHPPTVSRCLRAARYGRPGRDPRRARPALGWHREKRPYKRQRSGERRRASRRTAE